jgi:hypothetical protein
MTEIAGKLGEAKMSGEAIFDHGTFGFALASILAPGLLGGALQGFDLDRHRASELVEKLESFIARDCKFFWFVRNSNPVDKEHRAGPPCSSLHIVIFSSVAPRTSAIDALGVSRVISSGPLAWRSES